MVTIGGGARRAKESLAGRAAPCPDALQQGLAHARHGRTTLLEPADLAIQAVWADFGRNRSKKLSERIAQAIDWYPSELLFIHRDAETQTLQKRVDEILKAPQSLKDEAARHPVPIIPVRMTEAWLLISKPALRAAACNRDGKVPLQMPSLQALESLPDPNQILHDFRLLTPAPTAERSSPGS
jgi:hypothetical protein